MLFAWGIGLALDFIQIIFNQSIIYTLDSIKLYLHHLLKFYFLRLSFCQQFS